MVIIVFSNNFGAKVVNYKIECSWSCEATKILGVCHVGKYHSSASCFTSFM